MKRQTRKGETQQVEEPTQTPLEPTPLSSAASQASELRHLLTKTWTSDHSAVLGSHGHNQAVAKGGLNGPAQALPHLDVVQTAFGKHDVTNIAAYVGGPAQVAASRLGAEAFAMGNAIAFAEVPTLRTAAHEAAHVLQHRSQACSVQTRAGTSSRTEKQAEEVADSVAGGASVEVLLDELYPLDGQQSRSVNDSAIQTQPQPLAEDQINVVGVSNQDLIVQFRQTAMTGIDYLLNTTGVSPTAVICIGPESDTTDAGVSRDTFDVIQDLLSGMGAQAAFSTSDYNTLLGGAGEGLTLPPGIILIGIGGATGRSFSETDVTQIFLASAHEAGHVLVSHHRPTMSAAEEVETHVFLYAAQRLLEVMTQGSSIPWGTAYCEEVLSPLASDVIERLTDVHGASHVDPDGVRELFHQMIGHLDHIARTNNCTVDNCDPLLVELRRVLETGVFTPHPDAQVVCE